MLLPPVAIVSMLSKSHWQQRLTYVYLAFAIVALMFTYFLKLHCSLKRQHPSVTSTCALLSSYQHRWLSLWHVIDVFVSDFFELYTFEDFLFVHHFSGAVVSDPMLPRRRRRHRYRRHVY